MKLRAWSASDVGNVRDNNEDSLLADDELGVFVLADGVGGRDKGEVASGLVVETVAAAAHDLSELANQVGPLDAREHREEVLGALRDCLERANHTIFERGVRQTRMATTADVLVLGRGAAFVGHVGDSRVYMKRGSDIFRITEDHTYAARLKREGTPGALQLVRDNERFEHVLTRSVGGHPQVDVDTLFVDVEQGDRFLLCSDGLTDYLSGEEIGEYLDRHNGAQAVEALIGEAKRRGGHDNITVVLVEVMTDHWSDTTARSRVDTIRKVGFLEEIGLFAGLVPLELVKILRIVYERGFADGEVILSEGDPSDSLYLIVEGHVRLSSGSAEISRMGPGDHFGELSLFADRGLRTATATAEGDALLLAIPAEPFRELVREDPVVGNKLLWNLLSTASMYIEQMNARLAEHLQGPTPRIDVHRSDGGDDGDGGDGGE